MMKIIKKQIIKVTINPKFNKNKNKLKMRNYNC